MINKKVAFFLILLTIIVSILIIIVPVILINQIQNEKDVVSTIIIDGDLSFENIVIKNHWEGEGTEDNPYIIEGLSLKGNGSNFGLLINNVSRYFIINECSINRCKVGIFLNNSENGVIKNSEFLDGIWSGIEIITSNKISVINNSFSSIFWASIEGLNSNYLIFKGNEIIYGELGINLINSSYCQIEENSFSYNQYRGISIKNSFNNSIYNNYIRYGREYGIYCFNTKNDSINRNKIYNNGIYGIYLSDSKNNSINENSIISFKLSGLYIRFSYYITIYNNSISSYQGKCIYVYYSNKTFIKNNTLSNSERGIHIKGGFFHEIEKNNLYNIYYIEIILQDTQENKFFQNNLKSWADYSFLLSNSHKNDIINNSIYSDLYGIYFKRSSFNNVSLNTFHCVINIYEKNSYNNTISNNFS